MPKPDDDRLWTARPPTPTKPKSGERLWDMRIKHVTWRCELRYHAEWGVEAQLLREGDLVMSRRFDTRALAALWADEEREALRLR